MEFKELLEKSGMKMTEFSEYFNIPYPTIQRWKSGERKAPEYVLDLMEYKLDKEREEKVVKKFDLVKNQAEIKRLEDVKVGCTLDAGELNMETIATFNDKQEALKVLKNYKSDVHRFRTPIGIMYDVTEYFIEGYEVDEDGDPIGCVDIWEYSEMPEEF